MAHRQVSHLLLGGALALGMVSGCGSPARSPAIVEPASVPLPPSSGTPIGILIDESATLTLRADQVEELREIDRSLAASTEAIDMQLRSLDPKPAAAPRAKPGGATRADKKDEVGGKHLRIAQPPGTRGELLEQRDESIRTAIEKALDALDPGQRATAHKLLVDRGAYSTGTSAGK